MPIRINLLAEAQAAEEMRRRDPVKRALFVGVFLVVLMLVWTSSVMLEVGLAKRDLTNVQTEIQSRTNAYNQVMLDKSKADDIKKKLNALEKLNTQRFLQGNLMNGLQEVYVPGVQLSRIHVDQSYVLKPGSPPQTNQWGVIAGRPSETAEKVLVTLDARDFGANPGDEVNKFKDAITNQIYFRTMLDKTNGVRLASAPSAPQPGTDGRTYVSFTLECRYPEQIR